MTYTLRTTRTSTHIEGLAIRTPGSELNYSSSHCGALSRGATRMLRGQSFDTVQRALSAARAGTRKLCATCAKAAEAMLAEQAEQAKQAAQATAPKRPAPSAAQPLGQRIHRFRELTNQITQFIASGSTDRAGALRPLTDEQGLIGASLMSYPELIRALLDEGKLQTAALLGALTAAQAAQLQAAQATALRYMAARAA